MLSGCIYRDEQDLGAPAYRPAPVLTQRHCIGCLAHTLPAAAQQCLDCSRAPALAPPQGLHWQHLILLSNIIPSIEPTSESHAHANCCKLSRMETLKKQAGILQRAPANVTQIWKEGNDEPIAPYQACILIHPSLALQVCRKLANLLREGG